MSEPDTRTVTRRQHGPMCDLTTGEKRGPAGDEETKREVRHSHMLGVAGGLAPVLVLARLVALIVAAHDIIPTSRSLEGRRLADQLREALQQFSPIWMQSW